MITMDGTLQSNEDRGDKEGTHYVTLRYEEILRILG